MNSNRTFGVELEVIAPAGTGQQQAAAVLVAAGVNCNAVGYTHAVSSAWKIVHDGSVRGTSHLNQGMEIVSPILSGEGGIAQVAKVCRALRAAGFDVNRTCGMHVHVGARDLSLEAMKQLAIVYAKAEPVIDSLMPTSRRANNNTYCGSIVGCEEAVARVTTMAALPAAIRGGGRYVKLNFTAFWRYGTVEFRQHSGTVDEHKATKWIKVCVSMVEAAVKKASNGAPVAAASVAVQQPRRMTRRAREFRAMATRPNGFSREELAAAFGMSPTAARSFSLTQAARRAGVALERRGNRHYAATAAAAIATVASTIADVAVSTLQDFATLLGLDADDVAFWTNRAGAVA